ncbi:MAG: hypothetical protein R3C18_13480 [Planctomycetaceae bacterium]
MPSLRTISMMGLVLISSLDVANAQQLRVQPEPLLLADPVTPGARLRNLREAEAHLRAAGDNELADKLGARIHEEEERIATQLHEKKTQLEALMREIVELQQVSDEGRVVKFECLILKMNRDKLGLLEGISEPTHLVTSTFPREFTEVFRPQPGVDVLSRPQVIAMMDHAAGIQVGQEVPIVQPAAANDVRVDARTVGIKLELRPRYSAQHDERINLEACFQYSEADFDSGVKVRDVIVPALHESQAFFETEMTFGDTMCVILPRGETHVAVALVRLVEYEDRAQQ